MRNELESFSNADIDLPLRGTHQPLTCVLGTFSKRSLTQLKKFKLSERCFSGISSRQNVLSRERNSLGQSGNQTGVYVDIEKTMNSVQSNLVTSAEKPRQSMDISMRVTQTRPGTTCHKCYREKPIKPNT